MRTCASPGSALIRRAGSIASFAIFATPSSKGGRREASMASVEEKVKQIIVEQLGVDEGEVTATASFVDDLGRRLSGHRRTGHGLRRGVRHRDTRRGRGEDPHRQRCHRLHRAARERQVGEPSSCSYRDRIALRRGKQLRGSVVESACRQERRGQDHLLRYLPVSLPDCGRSQEFRSA